MLSLFIRKPATPVLFFVNAHVGRGSNPDMPAKLAGAYVSVYVFANDPESALREAFSQVTRRGYEFLELSDGKVHQMDPQEWDVYVKTAWPEFPWHFPAQSAVLATFAPGWVFFGPFAGYESQRA
ncbi:hypothetical protein [Xanthomonas arboricola]|uniref:hypothetical protein n=1 Tax=Xanthomonas arboricola TaxID=56448 RepID=UPI000CA9552E|nr:hypothetical protein [Xanthomonas arboricola]SOT98313.1 hypothetical protein CFBP6773_02013 [Xanthomonas arboricola pv. fragariae]